MPKKNDGSFYILKQNNLTNSCGIYLNDYLFLENVYIDGR